MKDYCTGMIWIAHLFSSFVTLDLIHFGLPPFLKVAAFTLNLHHLAVSPDQISIVIVTFLSVFTNMVYLVQFIQMWFSFVNLFVHSSILSIDFWRCSYLSVFQYGSFWSFIFKHDFFLSIYFQTWFHLIKLKCSCLYLLFLCSL